jgi:hypothetical protein
LIRSAQDLWFAIDDGHPTRGRLSGHTAGFDAFLTHAVVGIG